jgi:hypothetical protein
VVRLSWALLTLPGGTRKRSGSGSLSCPLPGARPPSPSSARLGTPLRPGTAWAYQCHSVSQVGRGAGRRLSSGSGPPPHAVPHLSSCSVLLGYHQRESQDEEPRAILAQRIEKETVSASSAGPSPALGSHQALGQPCHPSLRGEGGGGGCA